MLVYANDDAQAKADTKMTAGRDVFWQVRKCIHHWSAPAALAARAPCARWPALHACFSLAAPAVPPACPNLPALPSRPSPRPSQDVIPQQKDEAEVEWMDAEDTLFYVSGSWV